MTSLCAETAFLAQAALFVAMPKSEDASECLSDADTESTAEVRSTGRKSDPSTSSSSSDAGPVDSGCTSDEDLDLGAWSTAGGHSREADRGCGADEREDFNIQ